MNKNLKLVKVDSIYCDYLRQFDNKVMYNANNKELRPFVGILFEVNNYMYFAPLSSPKKKHLKMKNQIDFLKIDNGKLGAVNFNNMIPVQKQQYTYIDLNKKVVNKKEEKYQKLLKEQIYWLNRNQEKLRQKAKKLYNKYSNNTLNNNMMARCCNYKILEKQCKEYNRKCL